MLVVVLALLVSGCVNRANKASVYASLPAQPAGSVEEIELISPSSTGPLSPLTARTFEDGAANPLTMVPLPPQDGPVPIPGHGVLIVASVEKGAPVELRVTDEEQTQTVDLRAGKRTDDAIPGYYQPFAQELNYFTTIPLGFASGWAPAGRAWLAVPAPVLSTPISTDTPGLELTIDEAAVFTVRMTDGTEIPETGGTRQVTTLGGEFTTSSTAEFSNGRLPVSWQPDPQRWRST